MFFTLGFVVFLCRAQKVIKQTIKCKGCSCLYIDILSYPTDSGNIKEQVQLFRTLIRKYQNMNCYIS